MMQWLNSTWLGQIASRIMSERAIGFRACYQHYVQQAVSVPRRNSRYSGKNVNLGEQSGIRPLAFKSIVTELRGSVIDHEFGRRLLAQQPRKAAQKPISPQIRAGPWRRYRWSSQPWLWSPRFSVRFTVWFRVSIPMKSAS